MDMNPTPAQAAPDLQTTADTLRVIPQIRLLNKYVQKAKKVAIDAIHPVYSQERQLKGFEVRVVGPAGHLSYFRRLIDEANLKIS